MNLRSFPFAAIPNQQEAKRALMLLAVDPALKGALIASAMGPLLARALGDLLSKPFVEIPLNVTEDRLLGGLDVQATLATAKPKIQEGLLAQAHGRLVYINDINLLDEALVEHVAAALDSGLIRLEREGLSQTFPSEFALIGTYDPSGGQAPSLIRDRVALIIEQSEAPSEEERMELVNCLEQFETDPEAFIERHFEESRQISDGIRAAAENLSGVVLAKADLKLLIEAALDLGIEGNRVDIFAARAARASAALAGRDRVARGDLAFAIKAVLLPRARRLWQSLEEKKTDGSAPEPNSASPETALELILEAIDADAPDLHPALSWTNRARRQSSGRRAEALNFERGRYVRSGAKGKRVAIDATIRAAALNSAKRGRTPGRPLKITAEDLRFKQFRRKAGMLFIFAVDGSGSMASNRMGQAKGALIRLLERSYQGRDQVALVSFRGRTAQVVLEPTRSVERGRNLVAGLPLGGATPLAAGLLKSLEVALRARMKESRRAMILIFTDGRANVGLRAGRRADMAEELRQIGALLRREAIEAVVIDTRPKYASGRDAGALSELLGARYIYLGRADHDKIYSAIFRFR
jgi:magnesium chelatase subunit D